MWVTWTYPCARRTKTGQEATIGEGCDKAVVESSRLSAPETRQGRLPGKGQHVAPTREGAEANGASVMPADGGTSQLTRAWVLGETEGGAERPPGSQRGGSHGATWPAWENGSISTAAKHQFRKRGYLGEIKYCRSKFQKGEAAQPPFYWSPRPQRHYPGGGVQHSSQPPRAGLGSRNSAPPEHFPPSLQRQN